MNFTTPSMPEDRYRCRKQTNHKEFNIVCLIERKFNPAGEITKRNSGCALRKLLTSNTHKIQFKQFFMLKHNLYRLSTFSTTTYVSMQHDTTTAQQLQHSSFYSSSVVSQLSWLAQQPFLTLLPSRAATIQDSTVLNTLFHCPTQVISTASACMSARLPNSSVVVESAHTTSVAKAQPSALPVPNS